MKNQTTKKPIYKRGWFLIIAGMFIIGAIGNLIDDTDNDTLQEAEAQKVEQKQKKAKIAVADAQKKDELAEVAAQKKKVADAVGYARETGLLQKVDSPGRTVYLSPIMWSSVNAGTKQDVVKVMAQYMGHINGMDEAVALTVKDWQSGKTIAEYSFWSGVSIN